MTRPRRTAAAAAVLAGSLGAAGCTDDEQLPDGPTAVQSTAANGEPTTSPTTPSATDPAAQECYTDAEEERFPPALNNLSFPDRTIIYDVEVRGDNGILLTGVTDVLFRASAFQMRQRYSDPPFEIIGFDEGDTELGANWSGPSISGRWVVSDLSPTCPGDTQVTMLWTSQG